MNIEIPFAPLLDLLVKSAALILTGTALLAVMRKASAANRHAVSAAIFGALLLLPFTKLASARARWSFTLEKAAAPAVNVPLPMPAAVRDSGGHASAQPVEKIAQPAPSTPLVIPWKKLAVAVWLAGVALLLTRRALIALKLRAIVRSSRPIGDGRLAAKVRSVVEAGGVRAEVRESEQCGVPLASGIVRPVVLLPVEAADWSDAYISAALRHELGHIRRRDCITRLLADVLCALYWVNPLVWFAARQMRLAQEQACDDLVLNAGAPADEYAGQLVDVVRSLQRDRFTARHALAMAQPSTLETRVRAIVDESRDRSPRGAGATAAGCLSAAFTLAICLVAQVRGADQDKAGDAMRRGLAFLANQQQDDGSVGSGQYSGSIGLTGLAGLALMADDTHAERVKKIAKFIQSAQRDDGFIAGKSMYDHGYATLFLAEYFKAKSGADVKDSLAKAVALIVKSQGKDGGWRYTPTPADGDTSVSACQLMALVAARNAGVDVPAATFSAGVGFLKRCQNPDGGFGYTAPGGSAFARSAAALSASLATGKWTEPANQPDSTKGADYLMTFLPQAEAGPKNTAYFFHGHYYAGQALQYVGGDQWKRWQDVLRENLISIQKADGSWADPNSVELATSEACLILQTRNSVPAGRNGKIKTAQAVTTELSLDITPKKAAANADGAKADVQWIFPSVEFRDASVREIVDFLVEKSKTLNATGTGANIVLRNAEKIGDVKVTLSLKEIPLAVVLRYVAELANCEVVRDEFAFVIGPKEAGKVPAPNADQQKGTPGATIVSAPAETKSAALKKAGAIIFPKIDLREATLSETVDFLRLKSKELDPDKAGTNLILKAAAAGDDPKITISLANIPLSEALRYIAALAGYEIVADEFAITVRPAAK